MQLGESASALTGGPRGKRRHLTRAKLLLTRPESECRSADAWSRDVAGRGCLKRVRRVRRAFPLVNVD